MYVVKGNEHLLYPLKGGIQDVPARLRKKMIHLKFTKKEKVISELFIQESVLEEVQYYLMGARMLYDKTLIKHSLEY